MPRQFSNRGDKLVFTNGIIVLSFAAIGLVIAFQGDTSKLIPLYAVGVFLSFTLSQSGMVRHWLRERHKNSNGLNGKTDGEIHISMADPQLAISESRARNVQAVEDEVTGSEKWLKSLILNGVGAIATAVVLVVFIVTKFIHGAWLVVLVVPLLVWLFHSIHKHYINVSQQLSTTGFETLRPIRHEVIVPISGLHQGVLLALQYAKSISPDHVTAVFVDLDGGSAEKLRSAWDKWDLGVKLEVLHSPYRSLTRPLLDYIDKVDRQADDDVVTVILPEFVPAKWWHQILHNQSSLVLKGILLFKKGVIVTNVPYHLKH